ncbi:ras and ef-hand domain-containing protein [Anaeramoeba flamelloides]|uniref:Ras and ef-hand domain-containing protein n=1 Tax=Anaeramoeba flamelloides TaxID=1746091 RepID=A0ABQ8XD67_9EUKA|nr:ras and ef-hand domain-containing protein [Anaeramoeba flamelloides]
MYSLSEDSNDEPKMTDPIVKIVFLGQSGVGKTSIIYQFLEQEFNETMSSTVGASFVIHKHSVDDKSISFRIWDTSGQERFRSLCPLYYRNSHACVLVFDVTDKYSLQEIHYWIEQIEKEMVVMPMMILVGNKEDLQNEEEKDYLKKGNELAKELGTQFFLCSAKTGKGISEIFNFIYWSVLENDEDFFKEQSEENYDFLQIFDEKEEKKKNNKEKKKKTCCY